MADKKPPTLKVVSKGEAAPKKKPVPPKSPGRPKGSSNLTARQEAFCVNIVKHTMNQTAAYRDAYGQGENSDKTLSEKACRAMKHPKIQAKIAKLREPLEKKALFTLERHLENLDDLAQKAIIKGQISSAVNAEVAKGRASGFYVDRVKMDVKIDIKQVDSRLAALMAKLMSNGRSGRA